MSGPHRLRVIVPVLAAALATGCSSVGDLTGAVAGVAACSAARNRSATSTGDDSGAIHVPRV